MSKTIFTVIVFLLSLGANAQSLDRLLRAVDNNYLDQVKYQTRVYPEFINEKDDMGRTPLMHAAIFGGVDVVDHLLDVGAYINDVDKNLQSALMLAVVNNNTDVVYILVKNKARQDLIDIDGYSVGLRAGLLGNENIINILENSF